MILASLIRKFISDVRYVVKWLKYIDQAKEKEKQDEAYKIEKRRNAYESMRHRLKYRRDEEMSIKDNFNHLVELELTVDNDNMFPSRMIVVEHTKRQLCQRIANYARENNLIEHNGLVQDADMLYRHLKYL